EKNAVAGSGPQVECDAVASSGGLSPTVHLYCHDGGRPQGEDARLAFVVPATGRAKAGIYCVGAVTGEFRLEQALAETHQTIAALLATFDKKDSLAGIDIHTGEPETLASRRIFRVSDGKPEGHGEKAFVDFQNDVAASDIHLAVRENYHSIEHVKRYTALGFGTDQGKLSNVNGFVITARALKRPVSEVGTTTYRPAYTPVSLGALAGTMSGELFDPNRYGAIHASHVARGAAL